MLNFHKLEVFLLVTQTGSFSRAADGLLMTQSAVSHHMRDLEIQLGTSLFERGPRGVTLTPAGETLKEYVLQITALVAEAENAVTNVANLESGEIRVGATPGVSVNLLPDCIVTFHQTFPNLLVTMQTGISAEIIELLQALQIDLGILEGEINEEDLPSLKVETLYQIEQKVIIGKRHAWWGRESVSLADLDGQEFVMRQPSSQSRIWLDDLLDEHQIQPRISTVFDNIDSIKRSVVRGMCLAIMPDYTVQDELEQGTVQALSIEGKPFQRMLKLVWREDKPASPPISAFLEHMEECMAHSKVS